MKRMLIVALLALSLAGCKVFPTPGPTPSVPPPIPPPVTPTPSETPVIGSSTLPPDIPTPPPVVTEAPGVTAAPVGIPHAALENFTYQLNHTPDGLIPLQNGQYHIEQADPPLRVTSELVDHIGSGDLDGDGLADAAVLLRTNTGGSGSFYDLVPLLNRDGVPVQSGSVSIGDRQVIKDLRIENGRIVLDYLTQGPQDPLCCPSMHVLRTYRLEGGVPRLVSEQLLVSENEVATPVPALIDIDQPQMSAQVSSPFEVTGRIEPVPAQGFVEFALTDNSSSLLNSGQIPVQGAPGGAGTFTAQIDFDPAQVYGTILTLEIIYAENALLYGRSVVQVIMR